MKNYQLHQCAYLSRTFISGICLSTTFAISFSTNAADYNGPAITFSQIYANPDNQDLNLNYARQQAANGDYISAAAALERILYARPNSDSSRLFYALVLYRLDDKSAALRELNILENRPLTTEQRTQLVAYKSRFSGTQQTKRSSGFSGQLAVGVRYDDNAGNALIDNGTALANRSDSSAFLRGTLRYSTPINAQSTTRFNASLNGQTRRHKDISRSDYDTFGGKVGLSGRSDDWIWSVNGKAMQVNISGDKYLTQLGPELTLGKVVSERTKLWVSGTYYDQDYNELPFTVGETLRSGDKYIGVIGADINLTDRSRINISAGYESKNATNNNFSYDAYRIRAKTHTEFVNGVYMNAYAGYRVLNYKTVPILNITPPRREDNHFYTRLDIGAPFTTIGQLMGGNPSSGWENLRLETSLNYINRKSSVAAFDYDNIGVETRLIWDF